MGGPGRVRGPHGSKGPLGFGGPHRCQQGGCWRNKDTPVMAPQEPVDHPPKVVFIIGPTGVGKSRLGLDICLELRENGIKAEIVSADSMQVYKGCDIATAKASAVERQAVPHHLLDICAPQEAFSAADYLKAAKQTIQTLSDEGKLPVVVGGTQLYIQLLLWQSAVDLSVDERSARQANARREACMTKGRYDACIFWLDLRDREALEKRLRQRLGIMCQDGLLDEVRWVAAQLQLRRWPPPMTRGPTGCPVGAGGRTSLNASEGGEAAGGSSWRESRDCDVTQKSEIVRGGVLQGIGYKEFFPLVLPEREGSGASSEGVSYEGFEDCLKNCLELVVLRSLQYARQQRKWIRNKFLIRKKNVPLYFFETTDVAEWKKKICGPAIKIVEGFLAGEKFSEDSEFAAAKQMPELLALREDASENEAEENDGSG
ncbi:tRNA delta(2)-isopentenylpyrophosphate transferase, putative [Eimeria brunetti]|uniref:tRNA delta(2)-isopentenylpyrophosphate transferase, putative n=1 Tax=Eimeria brunetti TaxID=51314 RepID=U6LGH2_9EIME|nr:tRNA delta(2)-isopentenylpyrophosphate transferase, putative [Eimeria brunetti]